MSGHTRDQLSARTSHRVWHPAAQMKDYERFPALHVKSAQGSYLHLADGRRLIDATASWWCKVLGHAHPQLHRALLHQAEQLEHVMLAHVIHDAVLSLSKKLTTMMSGLTKVAYASDGACAVELAMKMSLHTRKLLQQSSRHRFMALSGAYHGETCGALAVTDLPIYRAPYRELLFDALFLQDIPYVLNTDDPLWHNCHAIWPAIERQLAPHAHSLTALIVEPLVQGAHGMRLYSADFLRRLRHWTQEHHVHLIADEIMTGLGRTGTLLACEQADIIPDFLCLGKGLTGGYLPLSAVITTDIVYDLFYGDDQSGQSFLHSHTYAGNALAAAVACACLQVIENEQILHKVRSNAAYLQQLMQGIAEQTGLLSHVRHIGAIVAADLVTDMGETAKVGLAICQQAAQQGALLRPLGNTIYWTLPLNAERHTMAALSDITQQALLSVFTHGWFLSR